VYVRGTAAQVLDGPNGQIDNQCKEKSEDKEVACRRLWADGDEKEIKRSAQPQACLWRMRMKCGILENRAAAMRKD